MDTPGLTAAQQRALISLLADGSHEAAASAARRSVRTVRRWLKTDAFQTALTAAGREVLASALLVLQRGAVDAATALTGMASGRLPPTSARVAACRATIELARNSAEVEELAEMVDELAASVAAQRGGLQ